MANLIPGLLKNRAIQRGIRALIISKENPTLTKLTPPRFPQQIGEIPVHFLSHWTSENAEVAKPLQFYPSFPFGLSQNPIFLTGFKPLDVEETDEAGSEDGRTIRADSVKKKRKRKMNKHKYKKLRKRLRRKTKL